MKTHLSTILNALPISVIRCQAMPQLFADSTHSLYRIDAVEGHFVLKLCRCESLATSVFWQGMRHWFDASLEMTLPNFMQHYVILQKISGIDLPQLQAVGSDFLLAKRLPGTPLERPSLKPLRQLAQTLSSWHQQSSQQFGALVAPAFSADQWGRRLRYTLRALGVADGECLREAESIECSLFSPVMMDLRWDQFLQDEAGYLSLPDLDAFVWADKRLDFVILEYLLNEGQREHFIAAYKSPVPDLSEVRQVYRRVLFQMNVLGEEDLDRWMAWPSLF